jgi:tRNA-binding protein
MTPFEAFQAVDLRVGRVKDVQVNEAARKPAYKMWIDFGEELGVKTSSGQYTDLYQPADLIGRLVVCAVNLGERRIAGFNSQVLVMGVPDHAGATVLLACERDIAPGAKVF